MVLLVCGVLTLAGQGCQSIVCVALCRRAQCFTKEESEDKSLLHSTLSTGKMAERVAGG